MSTIALPPVLNNAKGEPRKVGFELEFTGISLQTTAQVVAELFQGEMEVIHSNKIYVNTADYGKFSVELDVKLLQRLPQEILQAEENATGEQFDVQLKKLAVDVLSPMLINIAPTEIVTPPLPFEALEKLDSLCRLLRERYAKGTHASVIYAFGVHINPEVPAFDAQTIYRYIAAFTVLYDWLKVRNRMDLTRQATRFAMPFPKAYVELLLNKNYGNDVAALIDDYLSHNPTRNRALDMLPLFIYLDEARVRAIVPDQRVKARPTFHYRLPNCQIDDPNWSVLEPWTLWVEVEKLAFNPDELAQLAHRYKTHLNSLMYALTVDNWVLEVDQWLGASH